MGININGEHLSHLRYADDIAIFAGDKETLKSMIDDLDLQASQIGLKMNYTKTKTMTNTNENADIVLLSGQTISETNQYVYLGQLVKLNKENQTEEIRRRIRLSWAAFGKLSFILKNKKYPQYLKSKIFNQRILPVMPYGAQVWTLTKSNMDRIAIAQRSMERQMLHIRLTDKKKNEWIRAKTKVADVRTEAAKLKWQFAGHNARQLDNRWNKQIIHWRPWENKRPRGRPQMRWADDLRRHAGRRWMERAGDREEWKMLGEAYVQGWT